MLPESSEVVVVGAGNAAMCAALAARERDRKSTRLNSSHRL